MLYYILHSVCVRVNDTLGIFFLLTASSLVEADSLSIARAILLVFFFVRSFAHALHSNTLIRYCSCHSYSYIDRKSKGTQKEEKNNAEQFEAIGGIRS